MAATEILVIVDLVLAALALGLGATLARDRAVVGHKHPHEHLHAHEGQYQPPGQYAELEHEHAIYATRQEQAAEVAVLDASSEKLAGALEDLRIELLTHEHVGEGCRHAWRFRSEEHTAGAPLYIYVCARCQEREIRAERT